MRTPEAAPPVGLLSFSSPMTAVLLSAEIAIALPKPEGAVSSLGRKRCWKVQLEPLPVYSTTAPEPGPSPGPPMSTMVPSEETATPVPKWLGLFAPPTVGEIFVPVPQVVPERVNTHAAPPLDEAVEPWSSGAPISAVLPLAESETLAPNSPAPSSPSPTSIF